jgi:hypothetical protein
MDVVRQSPSLMTQQLHERLIALSDGRVSRPCDGRVSHNSSDFNPLYRASGGAMDALVDHELDHWNLSAQEHVVWL